MGEINAKIPVNGLAGVDELTGKVDSFDVSGDEMNLDYINPDILYFSGLVDKLIEIRFKNNN